MAGTLTWVLNSNSKYEISSKQHLIQVMNEGALYANEGSIPTNWTDDSFIQTADIDLSGESSNIKPLGLGLNWKGEYDGNGYTVSNWSYTDPDYPNASSKDDTGFFSTIYAGTVKNFRLAGVCTLTGFKTSAGMFAGRVTNSSNIFNIEVDLAEGSHIIQSDSETNSMRVGTVIGYSDSSGTTTALTFRGDIGSFGGGANASEVRIGGIVGHIQNATGSNTLFRNMGRFSSALSGLRVGGVVGELAYSSLTKALNAMIGDMTGSDVGGVIGAINQNATTNQCSEFVNSMTGTMTSTVSNTYAGGVVGRLINVVDSGSTLHSLMNYMSGDILNTHNSSRAGGVFGYVYSASPSQYPTSINAMNGECYASVFSRPVTTSTLVTVDTSFGLVFTTNEYSTDTPVSGLPVDTNTGLPIFDLSATDPDGILHTFDFVFGNFTSPQYSYLSTTPGVSSVSATVAEVPGALAYMITISESPSGTARVTHTGISTGDVTISALTPGTTYSVVLHANTGSGYQEVLSETVATLENTPSNYDKTAYATEGIYDLTTLHKSGFSLIREVFNDVFDTNDKLVVNVGTATPTVSFVRVGETISTDSSVLIPFDASAGSGQSITLNLSDAPAVAVVYDETSNSLNIGGTVVQVGDSIVVGSKKVTVKEV